jgi:uncharacterized protein (DUF433 family)
MTRPTTTGVTCTPGVCGGEPCIAGTRIKVANVLGALATAAGCNAVQAIYPKLSDEQIEAALAYAIAVLRAAVGERRERVERECLGWRILVAPGTYEMHLDPDGFTDNIDQARIYVDRSEAEAARDDWKQHDWSARLSPVRTTKVRP